MPQPPPPPPPPSSSPALIPGLPNDVASLILTFIPFSHHARLKPTCKSWRLFLSSKTLLASRRIHHRRALSHLICIFPMDPAVAGPYLFDPRHLAWCPLPLTPCNPSVYALCNFTSLSLGPHLYLIGGSLFDTRSFPIDRPSPSSAVSRFDFAANRWEHRAPMLSGRGSFACARLPGSDQILVAGGGSRHAVFGAAGSTMSAVERYDAGRDEWSAMEGLPSLRAGCVGFFAGNEEFWVMGGYGEARTISEVVPVDQYYRNAAVMEVGNGRWRETGDMWEEEEGGGEERMRLGKIVVVDNEVDPARPGVFMLDRNDILRYDLALNCWSLESHIPTQPPCNSSFAFAVLEGELYLITFWKSGERLHRGRLYIQVYHLQHKTWRTLITKSPFRYHVDFDAAVMSTVHL